MADYFLPQSQEKVDKTGVKRPLAFASVVKNYLEDWHRRDVQAKKKIDMLSEEGNKAKQRA